MRLVQSPPYTSSMQDANKIWLMLARKERSPSLLYAMPDSLSIKWASK